MDGGSRIESYANLAGDILARPSSGTRLIAVDGPGGAGKSLFAARLAGALGGAPVVHTDDFATGLVDDEWWSRLQSQVLDPLASGKSAHYRRYDWHRRTFAEWREVQPGPAVVVEGVSSARQAAASALALAAWVHAPRSVRLARGLRRDGEDARADWERWMREEDDHFRSDQTIGRCDVLVDGAPALQHDPEREFVRLHSCPYE